jgi:hypothetical protein
MRHIIFLSGLLLAEAAAGYVQATPRPLSVETGETTATTNSNHVFASGKCKFKIDNLQGGAFTVDNDSHIKGGVYSAPASEEWSFSVQCHAGASQSDVYDQIGAKPVNGKWIDLDFNKPFKSDQKFKLIEFAGKNWKGIGTAVDQIYYADADRRSRFFNFCLVENNGPQVLCGRTQIRGVTQPPSTSKLPKIMSVLKTIEFVDVPSSAPASAASTETTH